MAYLAKNRGGSRGFTLVELLAVIIIIGVLVALLLPAVQAAREAARQATCSNNFKQIGQAISNYESAKKVFPPGFSSYSTPKTPTSCPGVANDFNGKAGFSWSFLILPYMEGGADYDKWFTTNGRTDAVMGNRINPQFSCPSRLLTPMKKFVSGTQYTFQWPSYTAITGADKDSRGYVSRSSYNGCAVSGETASATYRNMRLGYGNLPMNGVLEPNATYQAKAITDGLSKVMLIGEQSDWIASSGACTDKTHCHGPSVDGVNNAIEGTTSPCAWWGPFGDNSVIINTQIAWNDGTARNWGNVTGITSSLGTRVSPGDASDGSYNFRKPTQANFPIRSAHAGRGAFLLFADGSVQFLTEGIDTNLFKDLAVRDQELVKQLP